MEAHVVIRASVGLSHYVGATRCSTRPTPPPLFTAQSALCNVSSSLLLPRHLFSCSFGYDTPGA